MFSFRSPRVRISVHTAELLDVYAQGFGRDMGVTITREQALERLVQVFIGNPLAAKAAQDAKGAVNG